MHRRGSKHNMDRHTYEATGARLYALRGSQLPQAVADEALVAKIRRQHARKVRLIALLNQRYSAAGIAKRYGLSTRAVERIIARDTWAHVA